jgi:hypothetical protein
MEWSGHELQSEAGYIDARPQTADRLNSLATHAGPYIRVGYCHSGMRPRRPARHQAAVNRTSGSGDGVEGTRTPPAPDGIYVLYRDTEMQGCVPIACPGDDLADTAESRPIEKFGGPGRTRTGDNTVMSGQKSPDDRGKLSDCDANHWNLPSSNFNHLSPFARLRAVCVPRGTGSNRRHALAETEFRW